MTDLELERRFKNDWDNSRFIIRGVKSWRCGVCNRTANKTMIKVRLLTEQQLYVGYRNHWMALHATAEERERMRENRKIYKEYGGLMDTLI